MINLILIWLLAGQIIGLLEEAQKAEPLPNGVKEELGQCIVTAKFILEEVDDYAKTVPTQILSSLRPKVEDKLASVSVRVLDLRSNRSDSVLGSDAASDEGRSEQYGGDGDDQEVDSEWID